MTTKLRLAEAIRLGSFLIPEPEPFLTQSCAIGMAMKANGLEVTGHPGDYGVLMKAYPWLNFLKFNCPWCNETFMESAAIFHPFDKHIMAWEEWQLTQITLEQLCDWLDSIDPTPRIVEPTPEEIEYEILSGIIAKADEKVNV